MSGISFQKDSASADQIARHLQLCDAQFTPALSSRVDIANYADRIAGRSVRFEAWSEGALVGLVAAYANDPVCRVAFVTNVSVLESWTCRGIGRRLLENCIEHVRRQGQLALRLEVADEQRPAIRLYEGLGFEKIGVIGESASGRSIEMRLELQPPPLRKDAIMKSKETFQMDMVLKGWSEFPSALAPDFAERMNRDCLKWIEECNQLQVQNGINASGDNTGHHALGRNDSLDHFLSLNPLHEFIDLYFEGHPYILHAFNPVAGAPRAATYVHRIHRDARSYLPGANLKLNMLVMLDDFTLENGATQFLESSHRLAERPTEQYFNGNHKSVTGARGTIVLFNSYLWHRGGFNATDSNRVALTVAFSLPFLKPQLDYARMLGTDYAGQLSPLTRQVLGYNAMTPVSLNEWYQPEPTRFYKSNQG
jgi:ribosomal protein S18 acetylase RimI-like enzyme